MNKKEFSAKTIDEALLEASTFFAQPKPLIRYNMLPPAKGGFFSKLFSRTVRIEAWVEEREQFQTPSLEETIASVINSTSADKATPAKEVASHVSSGKQPVRVTVKEKKEVTKGVGAKKENSVTMKKENGKKTIHLNRVSAVNEIDSDEEYSNSASVKLPLTDPSVSKHLNSFSSLFFAFLNVSEDRLNTTVDEYGNAKLHAEDDYLESCLTRSDKLSAAVDHVFKRIVQKSVGDVSGRVVVSAGNSEDARENYLKNLAKDLAEKVKESKQSICLNSKSPQERRTIHLSLDGYEGIGTRSVGTGDKRRLIIYPLNFSASNQDENDSKKGTKFASDGNRTNNKNFNNGYKREKVALNSNNPNNPKKSGQFYNRKKRTARAN